ncbi:membrane-targeted effector domain-containing toxin [Pseudomonas poae]|uniref:Toxin n=1 Tax=Pseudomonas poae TaxID=200451 RepID=A0A2S9EKZ4_9PSED|nr:membrane-targeted effector domain-containing toxin [Pseudomonas poae]PRA26708.1 toxin [Pseudomonas poae]PRC16029.1 toxin [Pseudomonas poae]
MSIALPGTPLPSFEEIRGYLGQIGNYLLTDNSIPELGKPEELAQLEQLNANLKTHNDILLRQARALYQAIEHSNLNEPSGTALLARLKSRLNIDLSELDERAEVQGKSRKSYLTFDAGATALENEAKLGIHDRLLHPAWLNPIENISRGPQVRPGLYALAFDYQDVRVDVAAAFVLTEQADPVISDLNTTENVGSVLLFTPARGLEAFDSLNELDAWLRGSMKNADERQAFMSYLPQRYHDLNPAGIWPLVLVNIEDKPLFEHTYQALLDKRRLDIDRALSLAYNPGRSATVLYQQLDNAVLASLPNLDLRLKMRAQVLLERCLRTTEPDWFRSATPSKRQQLAEHLGQYNQASQALLHLFGPAASPEALARYQLREHLDTDLGITDLDPAKLKVITHRNVATVGDYQREKNLIELALHGLHPGDGINGSAFLEQTTVTYAGEPLPEKYRELTPDYLAQLLPTLQPRVDFASVQNDIHSKPQLKEAIKQMLDQRINALAYAAMLQNHITEHDFQLIQNLRQGSDARLSASTIALHNAQLQDLWVLRQVDSQGTPVRLLLCAPLSPGPQQFQAFDSEIACQVHILGWSMDETHAMTDYLLERVALRFRPAMKDTLMGLSYKPHEQEYKEVTFDAPCTHASCLDTMAGHFLATQVDDQHYSTPAWYRSTTPANRSALVKWADDALGARTTHNADRHSEARFPGFNAYLHEQAKKSLNQLLNRPQNDVDPDTVWAYYPRHLLTQTPLSVNYTTLYRDGYDDSIGFLNEDFSASARFKGPQDIDLSRLTAQQVAASVRGIWIGKRYTDEVKSRLQSADSPGYAKRRAGTLAITQLQMRKAALESQLQGHISSVDLAWLDAAIQSMGDNSASTRHRYKIHRLFIDGDWIIDTYLFSDGDDAVLLYTPKPPDGIAFREARLFNYLLKKVDGMLEYLVRKAPLQSQNRIRTFLETARKQLPDHINRTSPGQPRYDTTERVSPLTDLAHELYNMKLQRKIDDVHASTVNRTQMITGVLWTCIEWVVAVATAPFPVLSLASGLLLAFKDAMLALHAYHQGDTDAALQHLLGYLLNAGGALFTDLRPLLSSIKTSGKVARPLLQSTHADEVAEQIGTLHSAVPSPEGMQAIAFRGESFWAPTEPDALGRYLLFRYDPPSKQLNSTGRLVEKTHDGNWRRSGVVGGAPKYEKLPDASNPLRAYELDPAHWRTVEQLLLPDFERNQLALLEWTGGNPSSLLQHLRVDLDSIHQAYVTQVQKLSEDANSFFKTPPVVSRPQLPALASNASHSQLIETVYRNARGLVIGESPESIASKQFLIENMAVLARQGVKRLYIEHLPNDVFRSNLQKLQAKGSSLHIENRLRAVDRACNLSDAPAAPSYLNLMKVARRHGIELKGIDATTSYDMSAAFNLNNDAMHAPRANNVRNFYSQKLISADLAEQADTPWVALVEHSRVRTSDQIPGLADLHNAIGLRIDDVATDAGVGVWADPVDFKLTLKTDYQPKPLPPTPHTPELPTATHYDTFDIAPSFREHIRELEGTHRGLDTRYSPTGNRHQEALDAFIHTRNRLKAAAEDFFTSYTPPTRAPVPDAALFKTENDFIKEAYAYSSGLVIGEAHASEASKKFLIEHMGDFKNQGVETLYLEHLKTDLHQLELNTFHQSAHFPDSLKSFLKHQDYGHMRFYDGKTVNYTGPYTYTNIVQAANKHGIRVQAIDCSASYHIKGLSAPDTARNTLFSYFSSQVISADQAARGPHKWLAFMGTAHTDTYLAVPGLADMHGVLSLHIHDSAPSLAKGFERGGWKVYSETKWQALRSDYELNVGFSRQKTPEPFVPADRSRLKNIGHFLIERPTPSESILLHKSNSGQIVSTPIQIDATGHFYIERWDALKDRRFLSQLTLSDALKHIIQLTPAP